MKRILITILIFSLFVPLVGSAQISPVSVEKKSEIELRIMIQMLQLQIQSLLLQIKQQTNMQEQNDSTNINEKNTEAIPVSELKDIEETPIPEIKYDEDKQGTYSKPSGNGFGFRPVQA